MTPPPRENRAVSARRQGFGLMDRQAAFARLAREQVHAGFPAFCHQGAIPLLLVAPYSPRTMGLLARVKRVRG
jgi:hypothetical protein